MTVQRQWVPATEDRAAGTGSYEYGAPRLRVREATTPRFARNPAHARGSRTPLWVSSLNTTRRGNMGGVQDLRAAQDPDVPPGR
jgi:hypothetical protein